MRWITLAWYCTLTGDTPDAVHARRRKKQWIDGVHCQVDPNGNLRINPKEYNKWVEQGKKSGS
ncbi:MAG: excisionase [Aquabacterium sp.]|nr:MAG: excisionase [Aquabacterium sp.]